MPPTKKTPVHIPAATEKLKAHIEQALHQAEGTTNEREPATGIIGCAENPALPTPGESRRLATARIAQEEAAANLSALAQKVMTLSCASSAKVTSSTLDPSGIEIPPFPLFA